MKRRLIPRRTSVFWLLNVLGWTAYAVSAFLLYYWGDWSDTPAVLRHFRPYLAGFLVSLALWALLRRIRRPARSVPALAGIVLAGAAGGAIVWLTLDLLIEIIRVGAAVVMAQIWKALLPNLLTRAIPMAGWVVIYLGLRLWGEWREQIQRTAAASALAQAAQLQMLRHQLNPHFLFNALNSIRALVEEDTRKAAAMVTDLSEFLRYSMSRREYADVPLKYEMEAVHHYFAIQKKRYENKLRVTIDVDREAGEYPVLSFLIHPLVENAVKYGMQTSAMPLAVRVTARVEKGALRLEVMNSGRWLEPEAHSEETSGTGTGLDNVRRRLENAYPGRHAVAIDSDGEGVTIRLRIGDRKGAENA